ncbi:helix-turn-helix domain-containing protein [Actinomadura flavalba]|uniref:helix-turn-helix domain-containing protein n=1 Tax=Actinomadura flavalba TaxID=1120938 RepID=UPI0003776D5F|nr:helix-turn-helix domain-containing protein [Actinomadura flavalba]
MTSMIPMKTAEVARLFGVTPYTVIRWTNRGLLRRGHTPTGRFIFDRAEVMELWKSVQDDR